MGTTERCLNFRVNNRIMKAVYFFGVMALALLFSADDVSCWRRRRRVFGIEKAAPRKRGQAMFDFVDKVENEPEDQQKEFEDNNVLVSAARSFPEDDEDELEELMEQVET